MHKPSLFDNPQTLSISAYFYDMSEILFERNGVRLLRFDHLTEEFRKQIKSTILGREGKLRYQHLLGVQKAEQVTETAFVQLHWKSRLTGVIAFSLQTVTLQNQQKKVAYVRYFSILGLLAKRQGHQSSKKPKQNSILKTVIKDLFDNPNLLFPDTPSIAGVYAYVEEDNLPSIRNVLHMGFEKVAEFNTFIYSRAYPKALINYEVYSGAKFNEVKPVLDHFYDNYNFSPQWSRLISYSDRTYAVYAPKGILTAGVCFSQNTWRIHSIPGLSGWLSRNLLSKLPYLKRIFFNQTFDFLTLEMAFMKEGEEHYFPKLVESILAQNNKHHALIWSDASCELSRKLKIGSRFGILHTLNQPTRSGLYFKALESKIAPTGPCYISADGIS